MGLISTFAGEGQNEAISTPERERCGRTPFRNFLENYFYFSIAVLCVAIKLLAVAQTPGHTVSFVENDNPLHPASSRPLVLWIHNVVFSAWLGLYLIQSALVRVQRVQWHRFLGWLGVGLGTVMVPVGIATAIVKGRQELAANWGPDAGANLIVGLFDALAFGLFFALAVWWRQRPESHRRLIFMATCGLLYAAFIRFDIVQSCSLFFPLVDLMIFLGVLRDLIVDWRVHKVYLIALPALIVAQGIVTYAWKFNSSWWLGIAQAIIG